jgi:hypothetical protein
VGVANSHLSTALFNEETILQHAQLSVANKRNFNEIGREKKPVYTFKYLEEF